MRRWLRRRRPRPDLSGPAPGPAVRLVESGWFDAEYYAAQAGRDFPEPVPAARDFLDGNVPHASPHPLVDVEALPEVVRDSLAERDVEPLLSHLGPATAPDPALRDRLLELARATTEQEHLAVRRASRQLRLAADELTRWAAAPLPTAEGPLVSVIGDDLGSLVAGQTLDHVELAESLATATAPHVVFARPDCRWRPEFLRAAVAAVHHGSLRAAHAAVTWRALQGHDMFLAFEGGRDHLMVENHVELGTLLVNAALARAVGAPDTALGAAAPHDFVLRLAAHETPRLLPFVGAEVPPPARRRVADQVRGKAVGPHWVSWSDQAEDLPSRVADRVSVVIPTWNDALMTRACVDALLATSGSYDVEVVVLDNGSRRSVSVHLVTAFAAEPRVRVERVARNLNFALGSNVGFARSTGATVVFLNNDTEPQEGWLEPLLEPLRDPSVLGVQPLLLYPDGTIQTAGTVFPPGAEFPVHTLVGEPPSAARARSTQAFGVVTAAALAMRAEDVVALRGFDPEYVNGLEDVDLCLRALQLRPGHFVVATDSVVVHHESKTEGRMLHAAVNKEVFRARWAGSYPQPH